MKLLVLDANNLLHRAYYGIRPLTTKQGVHTNALTGFFNIYHKLIKEFSPDGVAVAFDTHAPTYRDELYAEYKGGRPKTDPELAEQFPLAKEILTAMGVVILECPGFEADDIIGTLAKNAKQQNNTCIIASGDRDFMQLVTDLVHLNLASNKGDILFTPEKVKEVYGVTPAQMLDIKALMGDPSDNIPGVRGIGEKTALSLIQTYGSVDTLYNDLSALDVTPSVRSKLEAGKDLCYLSRELGRIQTNAPVSSDISDYAIKNGDPEALSLVLTRLEMFSLLKKLGLQPMGETVSVSAAPAKETQKLDRNTWDVLLLGEDLLVSRNGESQLLSPFEQDAFLQNPEPKRTFHLKELASFVYPRGIEIKNVVFDSTLCAYLLNVNASDYTLERLCAEYNVPYDKENPSDSLYRLNCVLYTSLVEQDMESVLTEIEIPLAFVLTDMEQAGVELDIDGVTAFGEELNQKIADIQKEIYTLCGIKFNISSPKQLGEVLFEKLMLPYGKKTKTGYSTNADVLESLYDKHPVIPLISEYRLLTKLYSTYVQGLLKAVSPDGRIHSTFKQTETRTGRISSAEPNIQNIPVRTELGRKMRKFFRAKKGYLLVDADYSQIELRVLASISGDPTMQNAFKNGDDIHTITAAQVFNQPIEWVTPEMRSHAKAVNFGIVYGIGAFSLSKDIGVSVAEADQYIKTYLKNYAAVSDYMEKTVAKAKEQGYVTTYFGRRRSIPELRATNKNIQAFGKRIAMNTPIQGCAADIIKIAMCKVHQRLKESELPARLILQVHDELIVEARADVATDVAAILKEEMESAAKLTVPLIADVNIGESWFDTH